jgi:methionine aminotransferase
MKIERLYGRRYDPETEITITSGATAAIFSTLTALVRPGDEVVLFQPCYDSYVPVVQLNGGVPKFVTLRCPEYRIDWDDVRRAIGPRTRLLLINSPHNPTGMVLTADDIRELKRVLEGTDALVVSDEVYEHIVFDGVRHESLARDPDLAARAVVISSFGKSYHTTGWKVGYAAAPQPLTAEIQRIHQFVTFTVNGAIQMAYAEMVNRDPFCAGLAEFYQAKRDLFLSLIAGSRFEPLACRGTYFQLLDYSAIGRERDSDMALRLLTRHGVASIPTSAFLYGADPGPVLRFCFAKRDETLERAAARLRNV